MSKFVCSMMLAFAFLANSSEAQVTTVPVQLPKTSFSSTNVFVVAKAATATPVRSATPAFRTLRAVKKVVKSVPPLVPAIQQPGQATRLIGYDQCGRPVYRVETATQLQAGSTMVAPQPEAKAPPARSSFSASYPNLDRVNELVEDPFESD